MVGPLAAAITYLSSAGFLFTLAFLAVTGLALYVIMRVSRGSMRGDPPIDVDPRVQLNPEPILQWEFEYARTTASEAMHDRHTMVNFYLLIAGLVTTVVLGIVAGESSSLPSAAGTILLWLLCCVGWIYFLQLIRLRQAWHDSARAMNQIKNFYIKNAGDTSGALASAFYWRTDTLSPPGKPWTVFFYSAALIALLDSVAFWIGGALLLVEEPFRASLGKSLLWVLPLGFVYFALHLFLYFRFLNVPRENPEEEGEP